MEPTRPCLRSAAFAASLAVLVAAQAAAAAPVASTSGPVSARPAVAASHDAAAPVLLAQSDGPRELQPRYEPAAPAPQGAYNDQYIFGITRGVADSTMHPAVKILFFPVTVPLDLVLLPFEAMGGLF